MILFQYFVPSARRRRRPFPRLQGRQIRVWEAAEAVARARRRPSSRTKSAPPWRSSMRSAARSVPSSKEPAGHALTHATRRSGRAATLSRLGGLRRCVLLPPHAVCARGEETVRVACCEGSGGVEGAGGQARLW